MAHYLVLDYYVDEPACFGVPPFISPYVRYTYGALKTASPLNEVDYLTVDELRIHNFQLDQKYDGVFLIAGTTVPGRYLGGKIGSLAEVLKFSRANPNLAGSIYLGGPIKYATADLKQQLFSAGCQVCSGDIEELAYQVALGRVNLDESLAFKEKRSYDNIHRFSLAGAGLIQKHFRHPHHIIELETYRGCTRSVYCSFCTEAFYGRPQFRPLEHIIEEVSLLYELGARNFRLGRQADLYTYNAHMNDFKNSFPRPDVKALELLYTEIRRVAPGLQVLHLDNTNPGLISTFPVEAEAITEIISDHNTVMDTAAMGMESADDVVIARNDLKANADEVSFAIRMIHKYGERRINGLPRLTAGINLIGGLPGESENTFDQNFNFLKQLLDDGIFLRRINIRQVWTFEKTKLSSIEKKDGTRKSGEKNIRKKRKKPRLAARFDYFKQKIRDEIDSKMLRLAFPPGSIIEGVILEKKIPGGYLGRPLGSYPITCHVYASDEFINAGYAENGVFGPYKKVRAIVTGYKERALYTICLEDNLEKLPRHIWQKIAGKSLGNNIWQNGLAAHAEHLPGHLRPVIAGKKIDP